MIARDVAVVGAGCFGAWTALGLRRQGLSAVLVDRYGAANTRASSAGESRIIRMGYGSDELYTKMSQASFTAWQRLAEKTGRALFHETGVLWLGRAGDRHMLDSLTVLERAGVAHERLGVDEIRTRYPQFSLDEDMWGIFEPESGALMARRAVPALVREAVDAGVEYRIADIAPPSSRGRVRALQASDGTEIRAGMFVFACGAWLPKVFPELLGERIFPTRQDELFFGPPPGDGRFAPERMPTWIDFGAEMYGLPDLEGNGVKISTDGDGETIDPDGAERLVSAASVERVRAFIARRIPILGTAPLVHARVCQYENTSNGDFLIDRHPDHDNVWIAGGGSGHGFKHGPAVGEYVGERLLGRGMPEPRFALATKDVVKKRAVF